MDYKGYRELNLDDEKLAHFYNNKESWAELYMIKENQYLLVKDSAGEVVDKYCFQNGELRQVLFQKLGGSFTGAIKPRNPQQACLFDMLKDKTSKIKLVTGRFGSGKTLAMTNAALELIEKGKFERIVWVRNNVSVKDAPEIGYLPGTEIDKLMPYVMPLADHAGGEEGIKKMLENGTLEVIPLGHLRGRSLRNCIVFCTECENLTRQHIQLLMGRIDEGSQLWLDGDVKQRDKDIFEKSAGLERMIERLAGNKLFAHIHLEKSERSEVAALADLLDD
jgi:PhoH-like ATPase